MITIKTFKAANGDAFLLKFDNGQNILIDMGMPNTYENEIKKELMNLNDNGQKIDLLIISHIDEDHIGGAIKFLKDNKSNEIIEISEIWHNSFKHLQFDKEKVLKVNDDTRAVLNCFIDENIAADITDGIHNISCKQGSSFASLIYKYGYNWNTSFSNDAIYIENKSKIEIGDLKFIFLSPNKEKLKKLSKKWLTELKKKKLDFEISNEDIFDDAFEFYMKFEQDYDNEDSSTSSKKRIDFEKLSRKEEKDNSKSNGSSLAFIIEFNNQKLLFLGDAHEDIVYESLIKLKDENYDLIFDLVKVSHHGSNKNISTRLIELINSQRFLFSTDGLSHNHPDLEAISKIVVKKTKYKKELFFNYEVDLLNKLDNEDLKNEFNYEIKHQNEMTFND